jgi:hypothetical protein
MDLTKKANNQMYKFASHDFITFFNEICKLAEWKDIDIIQSFEYLENLKTEKNNKQFTEA